MIVLLTYHFILSLFYCALDRHRLMQHQMKECNTQSKAMLEESEQKRRIAEATAAEKKRKFRAEKDGGKRCGLWQATRQT